MQIFHWGVGEGTSSSDERSFSVNNFARQASTYSVVKIIIIKSLSVFFN